jgi:hypothetical protein
MKYIFKILALFFIISSTVYSQKLDLDKLCKEMYNIYDSDEIPAKKELLAYKKLEGLIGKSVSVKITTTDSINYDRKSDITYLKSKEVFTSDNKTGYFGVFVLASQKGDELMLKTSPDKEITISGTITDVIITGYIKNHLNHKEYTPIKDFDDKGTIIQQVVLRIEM